MGDGVLSDPRELSAELALLSLFFGRDPPLPEVDSADSAESMLELSKNAESASGLWARAAPDPWLCAATGAFCPFSSG